MPNIDTGVIGDVTIVDLTGKFRLGREMHAIRNAIRDLRRNGSKWILVNLGDVKEIDRCCIGQLRRSKQFISEQGGALKLLHPAGRLKDMDSITQLVTHFDCFDKENIGVHSFSPVPWRRNHED